MVFPPGSSHAGAQPLEDLRNPIDFLREIQIVERDSHPGGISRDFTNQNPFPADELIDNRRRRNSGDADSDEARMGLPST